MIRRRCKEGTCKNGRRCLEHLRFDVMWRGRRYRMPVNEYAIPRMESGKQRLIESMEEARDWERRFIGEIKAGRDPRYPAGRSVNVNTQLGNVAEFLDAYFERCARPAGLRSLGTVRSQLSVLKEQLGRLPLSALEEPDEIIGSRPTPNTPRTWSWHRCTASSNDYAPPSTGAWRRRLHCSQSRRSIGSACG